MTHIMPSSGSTLWHEMQHAAGLLSAFTFLLLFATIGISADLEVAFHRGLACLGFLSITLAVHGIFPLTVSWWIRQLPTNQTPIVGYEDILIASNATIGGPTMAATFCGTLPNNT